MLKVYRIANITPTFIDIRIQQRNGRKVLTTVQGIPKTFDKNKLIKRFKKDFACNGTIIEDEELGTIVQLSGDQRLNVSNFLVNAEISTADKIKLHGF